eukprot:474758-Hanusia_phi.AAC.1
MVSLKPGHDDQYRVPDHCVYGRTEPQPRGHGPAIPDDPTPTGSVTAARFTVQTVPPGPSDSDSGPGSPTKRFRTVNGSRLSLQGFKALSPLGPSFPAAAPAGPESESALAADSRRGDSKLENQAAAAST